MAPRIPLRFENGEYNGHNWTKEPFTCAEPEHGRFTLVCCTCLRDVTGFNLRYESPMMFVDEHTGEYTCDDCKVLVFGSMPYDEYLQTPHWKNVAWAAKERARYKCQLCGRKRPLQAHHNDYSRVGRELPEDVITLCRPCHAKHHGKGIHA